MSYVTAVMLCAPAWCKEEPVQEVNDYLEEKGKGKLVNITDHAGGYKHMECRVFAGGFNYLDIEDFLKVCQAIDWDYYREDIQIFIRTEGEGHFTERFQQ